MLPGHGMQRYRTPGTVDGPMERSSGVRSHPRDHIGRSNGRDRFSTVKLTGILRDKPTQFTKDSSRSFLCFQSGIDRVSNL